ncbi:hypothetical protein V2W45_1326359 [Cenococcum geophilum]
MATLITSTLTAIAKTTLITRPLTTMAISSISKHGGKRNDAQPRSGLEPFTIINWREVESNRLDQRESTSHPSQSSHASSPVVPHFTSTSTHSAGLARPGAMIAFGRPPIGWLEPGNRPEAFDDTRYTITRVRNKGEKDEFSETDFYTTEGDATSYDSSSTDDSDDEDDHELWGGHSMVKRKDARDGDTLVESAAVTAVNAAALTPARSPSSNVSCVNLALA